MPLPLRPPIAPMLATLTTTIPRGDLLYEPKWDGFRALAFVDGGEVYLQSRDDKPLARYFPELVKALSNLPDMILDGEIVIAGRRGLEFETLQLRLHPAASRIARLAAETPASFVAFDLLARGADDLRSRPQIERRAALEAALAAVAPPVFLTPATTDPAVAQDWFSRFEGAGLDGVMAKPTHGVYAPGLRTMIKVKHERTADCVVAGFRWHKNHAGTHLGSLVLGLYDDAGDLHHVGVAASFTMARRKALVEELAPLRDGALEAHPWRAWAGPDTGGQGFKSRWSADRDLTWEPLRLERVVEVRYDHLLGRRFRHTTHVVRWRDDKRPADCTFAQLEVVPPAELAALFAAPRTSQA
ncbi:MAG: ATP-dependent DNA ligase [Deltaproteobacteria bacterium]|nr:ATP-dependent DNA ligase [Deltaproteobacteria bacterium]